MGISTRFVAGIAILASSVAAYAGGGRSLPVMTAITVKMDQAVDAKNAANGTAFTAILKEPVEVGGQVIIPAGASAGGIMDKEPGAGTQFELNSVFVNGRLYRIATEPVAVHQKGSVAAGSTLTFHLTLSLNLAR